MRPRRASRKPVDRLNGYDSREAIWRSIRARRNFTVKDVHLDTTLEETSVRDYIRGLTNAGYLQEDKTVVPAVYTLVKDIGIDAPRVRKDGTPFPVPGDGFMLYRRFTHVWEEWKRVGQSGELLRSGDMAGCGRLMNEAHASARDLHEISCRELDTLTELARAAGALGSRLTGAGFGGCAVNIVPDAQLPEFIAAIKQSFYCRFLSLNEEQAARYIFPVRPVQGASLVGFIPLQTNHDSGSGMQAVGAGG